MKHSNTPSPPSNMSLNSITSTIGSILYLSVSLFYLPILLEAAYVPVDSFSINCGSSGNSSDGDRTWTGDINSKLLSLQDNQTVTAQTPSTYQLPYTTARLSYSEFTYSFHVITAGPKFVRLFFYPASYPPNFDRPNALFTVKSGGFTLLKDFNASLTADADHTDTIFREYIINVDDGQRINLTFTPTTSYPNSYAFVNGIEVVSMPFDLYYYTAPYDQGFEIVGTNSLYSLSNNTALETDYRVKVGGRTITPKYDTGLLRSWKGNDADYLMTPTALYSLPGDISGRMSITVNPDYVAPTEVYRTAREMGMNGTLNKGLNLTWEFPVDSGFTYMVRLHFCELDPNVTVSSDRAFFIYIAGQLAEDHADVLKWSKEKGVAVHTDYALFVQGNNNQKKTNLSLQMHPLPDSQTLYSDPFLNGLEIFKISDAGTNNLAGPNPDPVPAPHTPADPPNTVQNSNSNIGTTIVGVVAGVVYGVVLLSVVVAFFILRQRKKKKNVKDSKSTVSRWGPFSTNIAVRSSLPSALCRNFSIVEVRAATNNFDELLLIGVGGFGNVYKGYIDGGHIPVAIKRLKPGSQQGAKEFMTEIEMLSQLRHLHLVSLIGYCYESNEMILVYDFMTRGTLRDHLYNTGNLSLSWKQRLQICIGAARGLHYLHSGAKHNIIHRDVKTTNILLDEKWVAKVSDFGLSKIGPTGISKTHVSTVVKGSLGYLDPEYYKRQCLTEKSDMYSFGVVLFEVLCARPPLIRAEEKKQMSLADWAKHCYNRGTLHEIVDPALKGKIAPECLKKFGDIAVSCLLDDGTQRPCMNDIVWMLEFALQLQESVDTEQGDHTSGMEVIDVIRRDDSNDTFSSSTSGEQVSYYNQSSVEHSYGNKESDRLMRFGSVSSETYE